MIFLTLFAILVILAGAVLYSQHQRSAWQAFAAAKGLQYLPGSLGVQPQMTGTHRGLTVVIDVEMRGGGKSRHPYTRCTVRVVELLPTGFALAEEGLLSGVSRFFGSQDIVIGDPELDAAAMIKGEDEAAVQRLLRHPSAREAALRVARYGGESRLEHNSVRLIRYGMCTDTAELVGLMDAATETAAQLAEAARATR